MHIIVDKIKLIQNYCDLILRGVGEAGVVMAAPGWMDFWWNA